MPKILIPTPLRQFTAKQDAVTVQGATVKEALDGLTTQHPDLRKQIDLGYRLAAGRPARPKEIEVALAFLKTEPKREFALLLLNLNSFVYVN